MAKETIQIADKPTLDKILEFLLGDEAGLAVLKSLLVESADKAESTTDDLKEVNRAVDTISGYLTSNTYGLNAIKTAISGRASESTSTVIKGLLENGTYGLNALKNAVTGRANESTSTAIKSLLENGTYGLNALKTAIGNSNKFTSTKAGVLQLKGTPTVSKTVDANNREVVLHSPEIIISGNGQIVMHSCVNNNGNYATINHGWVRMEDVIIDGVATNVDFQLNHTADYSAVYNRPLKFEFSKSFRCKIRLDGKVYGSVSGTPIPECDFGVHYYVQLR